MMSPILKVDILSLLLGSNMGTFLQFSLARYQVYKARRQLVVIDCNYHVDRATATNEKKEARHTRKYNQRTKEWKTRVVKVSKDIGYIPIQMAKIFKRRFEDLKPIDRHVSLCEDDPARIAPTIAEVLPVPSKELYIRHQSRFSKCTLYNKFIYIKTVN